MSWDVDTVYLCTGTAPTSAVLLGLRAEAFGACFLTALSFSHHCNQQLQLLQRCMQNRTKADLNCPRAHQTATACRTSA